VIEYSAPGRCGIVGNPSDIYGGKVLSCSIPARAKCRLMPGDKGTDLEDPLLWKAATARYPISGLEVGWSSDIPRSSGLSGSTALLASTLAAVLTASGTPPNLDSLEGKQQFAELLRDIEFNEAQIACGFQDAYMIVFGGLQLMDFAGKSPDHTGPPASLQSLRAPLPFLLITTGVERVSGSVHRPVMQRWQEGDRSIREGVAEIADLAEPAAQALCDGAYGKLAELMSRNQEIVSRWGGSGEAVDQLIADCLSSGAMAAKLAGAGQGGTVIALTEDASRLELNLKGRGYTRFLRPSICPGIRFEK
jgi:galactokinase/mevalonate kinase-like predicted kinase